jgi:transcriptional regulator with XRE-family HTH domain
MTPQQKKLLPLNLRYLRTDKLSSKCCKLTDIAELCGVSAQSCSRWEHGTAYPDKSQLKKLCTYFGVSEGDMLNSRLDGSKEDELLTELKEIKQIILELSKRLAK